MVKLIKIMKLKLERVAKKDLYIIGKLYINDVFFCNTLEDTDRGLRQSMSLDEIKKIKQKGITAIPYGIYTITMNVVSPKYSQEKYKKQYGFTGGKIPRLENVPGFEGILIHIGNYPKDTNGCILVGENKQVGAVINSTKTFKKLYTILKTAADKKDKIEIEII